MYKRAIKNNVTITLVNNSTGKTFTSSKREFEKEIKRLQTRMAALGLAVGIGIGTLGTPLISNIAKSANEAKSTKEAIEIVNTTNNYLESIRSNPTLQAAISAESISRIQNLEMAINSYKQFRHKEDRTYGEEQCYIEACKTIAESKNFVIDLYTNTIKAKVAKAYGITKQEEIAKIQIKDPINNSATTEPEHNPNVLMPDGTRIGKGKFLSSSKKMDSVLTNNIINARSLIDERDFSENVRLEDLPVEHIIQTFEEAKKFERDYNISLDKNGNLKVTEVNQDRANRTDEIEK